MDTNTDDADLCIFKDMDGFEDFDIMDNFAVAAIFDDLQDGTLSVLDIDLFDNAVCSNIDCSRASDRPISQDTTQNESVVDNLQKLHPTCGCREKCDVAHEFMNPSQLSKSECSVDVKRSQSTCPYRSANCESRKRIRYDKCGSDSNNKEPKLANIFESDLHHRIACVQHDHCYFTTRSTEYQYRQSSLASGQSDSLEEGSTSDGGYETMSVSTSPGTCGSNNECSSIASPETFHHHTNTTCPLLPLASSEELADPVALIDARIKHFMCDHEVNLTEEEKETLKLEGLPIPTTLPLTKIEEKALRNIRKKIRNKVAAQESRRRKKEHLVNLEERVKESSIENMRLKKRIEALESENKVLLAQLNKFRMLAPVNSSGGTHHSTQVGACLMVIVLCFGVFMGTFMPKELWNPSQQQSDYATISVRSRSLLSLDYHQTNFQNMACSWFHDVFTKKDSGSSNFHLSDEDITCRTTYIHMPSMCSVEENILNYPQIAKNLTC